MTKTPFIIRATGALALCAAVGLAALTPSRAEAKPAPQEPTIKVMTKILLNINGDKIELSGTDLKPDTRLKVNGKEVRFGDLTAQQQKELSEAVSLIHLPDGKSASNVTIVKTSQTKILLDINGDKIELNGTDLKPDTHLKVNGKEARFGDLTPAQQQQIKAATAQIPAVVSADSSSLTDASSLEDALKGLGLSDEIKKEITDQVQETLDQIMEDLDNDASPDDAPVGV